MNVSEISIINNNQNEYTPLTVQAGEDKSEPESIFTQAKTKEAKTKEKSTGTGVILTALALGAGLFALKSGKI